jgi:ketosteroid isomerase-like protein
MRNRRVGGRFPWLLACVPVLTAIGFAPASVGAPREDMRAETADGPQANRDATVAIKDLIANYAQAVNAEPVDLDLASQVWLNSPEVSLIYPLGEERGWEEVKRNFYQNIMEALFSERKLTPGDITVHVYGGSAWAEFSWRFVAKSRKNGSTMETRGRETQIYRKLGRDRWALVHVHYSAMPPSAPSGGPAVP